MADDGIKLTDDEREALETWDREGVYACPHTHHCPTPDKCREKYGLHAAVESIIAARVQALTAERNTLRIDLGTCERMARESADAARAELAAANARIAELERRGFASFPHAENAALSARLERVRAVADDWNTYASGIETTDVAGARFGKMRDMTRILRAALGEDA